MIFDVILEIMKNLEINPLSQFSQAILGFPKGCNGLHPGYSQAKGCAIDEVFECSICGEIVPWCKGADDDMPDACDDCWVEAHKLNN